MMVSCNDGHDEIYFEGEFRALCPLCKMRADMQVEIERAEQETRDMEEAGNIATRKAEGRADDAEAKLDKMEEDRDGWKARAEELQAEIDKLKENK